MHQFIQLISYIINCFNIKDSWRFIVTFPVITFDILEFQGNCLMLNLAISQASLLLPQVIVKLSKNEHVQ